MTSDGFIDARDSGLSSISGSVCIVGSGAAGLTLAAKLAETKRDVILIESGGFSLEGDTQELYSGRNIGLPYHSLTACRLRYFGGTTNHWSGYCRANDAIDYEGRSELDLPKWPVGQSDLEPWISEASRLLRIQPDHFDPMTILRNTTLSEDELLDSRSTDLESKVFQITWDYRFADIYKEILDKSESFRAFMHLNLCHIQLSSDGSRVSHLECATLSGKRIKVDAQQFVLCCHGIENARLLLTSNDVLKSGIGNQYDHVGRYFMDHIYFHASRFVPNRTFPKLYSRRFARVHSVNVNLSFNEDYLRDNKMLQYYCRFNPVRVDEATEFAMRRIRTGFFRPGDTEFLQDIMTVAKEISGAADFMLAKSDLAFTPPAYYGLEHRLEQQPNPNSRVVISDRRDQLGNLIADLDWQITDTDVDCFERGQSKIAQELAVLGLGRVQEETINRELVESRVLGHYHQIGTARMSEYDQDGVVDENCKVHGVANLFIGGSSVFPTAGYSGPTMMIVALSLRLGAHLAEIQKRA